MSPEYVEIMLHPMYDLPPLENLQCTAASSAFSWLGQKCRRFSRLAGQSLLMGINTIFFAGKVCKSVPSIVTKSALTALSGVGLVFIPYNADFLRKVLKDAYHGQQAGYCTVTALASLKAIEVFSNLGLVLAGLGASLEGMAGRNDDQKTIYSWMTPIGEATLVLGMGMTVAYMVMNHMAIKKLKLVLEEGRAPEVIQGLVNQKFDSLQTLEEQSVAITPDKPLASLTRFCMDKDTLEQLLHDAQALRPDDSEAQQAIVHVLKSNIETQQKINLGGQLVLILIGDVLLAVEKYYTPNSAVSASINLGVSGAYTLKILVETLREVYQRRQLTTISHAAD